MSHLLVKADAARIPLPDQSVDLVLGSPPYCDARTYGIGAQRDCQAWVDWMLLVTAEALRVSRGAVIWVAAGVTRDRTYWPAVEGLMYEWWKRGGSLYRPCYWHRVGIPGSGGDQWFRADVEYCACFKRPGRLPWTNNTAMGHPPKWAPGGEMSCRLADGSKRNQWGGGTHKTAMSGRNANGEHKSDGRKSHVFLTKVHTKRRPGGEMESQTYLPPVLANPGNLLQVPVGGGCMGSNIAHENEASYSERVPEFFIASLCKPAGQVLDPFSGSGTTVSVAEGLGRRGIGLDLRMSQCKLGRHRLETPWKPIPKKGRKEFHPLFPEDSINKEA